MSQATITYFDRPGPENTDQVLAVAKRRADELGINTIVVASTRGMTGVKASEVFRGRKVIVVSHCTGFAAPDTQELSAQNRAKIEANGGIVFTGIHALGGIGRAVRRKFKTYELDDLVAFVLRIFGEGMKVCCEIAVMAADAGLVSSGEQVIAIAGSGTGADTAVVLRTANVQDFFDLKVNEIICKPLL